MALTVEELRKIALEHGNTYCPDTKIVVRVHYSRKGNKYVVFYRPSGKAITQATAQAIQDAHRKVFQ